MLCSVGGCCVCAYLSLIGDFRVGGVDVSLLLENVVIGLETILETEDLLHPQLVLPLPVRESGALELLIAACQDHVIQGVGFSVF